MMRQKNKLLSFMMIGAMLLSLIPSNLSFAENETQTTVNVTKKDDMFFIDDNPAYGTLSETESYTTQPIEDNDTLVKAMYYSYGSIGYDETIPMNYTDDTTKTKIEKANAILMNLLNGTTDTDTTQYVSNIESLPEVDTTTFLPYYIYNTNREPKVVGVTYQVKESDDTDADAHSLNLDENIAGGEENSGLLGTSNGNVAHEPSAGSSGQITNPATYGLPTNLANIPSSWLSANSSGGWNASSVKLGSYNFTYTSNSNSGRNTTYQPATARITSGTLNGLSIYLSTCRTGTKDSAPTSSNASGGSKYGFNTSDLKYPYSQTGDCKMNVWVTKVDQTNHRVYLLFFTDYISYDSSRSNTSVQSVGGSMWYTFSSEEYITVTKDDFADYLSTMKNADANLSALTTDGITFGIYKSDKRTLVCKYFIDATGKGLLMNDSDQITPATVKPLPAGEKYYIKELSGNAFYKVDSTGGDGNGFYEFTPHNTSSSSPQQIVRVDDVATYVLNLKKVSANPNCTNGNQLYSLAGAEYVLRDRNGSAANFIVGYETISNYQDSNGRSTNQTIRVPIFRNTNSSKLVTDGNGNFRYTFTYDGDSSNITNYYPNVRVGGNKYTIVFTNGIQVVAGTYRLSETKAPSGYKIDPNCREDIAGRYHEVTVGAANPTATITCKEPPRMDPLQYSMTKMDSTYGEVATGKGSLDGTIFEVAYYNDYYTKDNLPSVATAKWYFKTENGAWEFRNSPLYNGDGFVSNEAYKDTNGQRTIPMGTVTVKEVKAPDGYALVNDQTLTGKYMIDGKEYNDTGCILYQFRWSEADGRVLRYLDGGNTPSTGVINEIKTSTYDTIKRGDIDFDKINIKTGEKMQHIGFLIKSKTTGEQHIIVTDENGHASSRTPAHSENTNENDKYIDDLENDEVLMNQLNPTGIWFYGTNDKTKWDESLIDDNIGAMPYDDYDVKEICSDGTEKTQLIDWGDYTFSIVNNKDVDVQTLIDMDLPHFSTNSADKTLDTSYTVAEKDAHIIDTISYQTFRYNHTYTFKGIMVAREDCVLDNGTAYKAGEPILDDNGKYIRSNVTFTTPKRTGNGYVINASGEVELEYTFDAESLSGAKGVWKTYLCDGADDELLVIDDDGEVNREASNVMSERLKGNDRYYYEDIRLNNTNEWINFPSISLHTTALSEDSKTHDVVTYTEATVIDTVSYTNLLPNRTYKLVGTAMNKETEKPILVDGKEITVEHEFTTPNTPVNEYGLIDGTEDVTFEFNPKDLLGIDMVVFEKLYIVPKTTDTDKPEKPNYVGGHEDIKDEGQSIHFVDSSLHTTALSEDTQTHEGRAYTEAKVIDTVEYTNLLPNRKYKLIGTAMDQESGEALTDKDGNIITVEHEFTTRKEPVNESGLIDGTEDVTFEFDSTLLAGKSMVVFEELYLENKDKWVPVSEHEDIEDEGQTVHFSDLKTTALDKKSETHESKATRKVTVVDKVEYSNLIIGKKYTVKGILMLIPESIGSATSKEELGEDFTFQDYKTVYDEEKGIYIDENGIECQPFLIDGKPVTGETTFTAEQSNGTIEVSFTFDARSLKGKDIVVFEDLYNEGGIHIGSHADIFDKDQTITVVPSETGLSIKIDSIIGGKGKHHPKTGDIIFFIILGLFILSISIGGIIMAKKKKYTKTLLFALTIFGSFFLLTNQASAQTINENVKQDGKNYKYEVIEEYETTNKEDTYSFPDTYKGKKLSTTSQTVVDTTYPEKTETITKTYSNRKDQKAPKTITKDGVTYTLSNVKAKEVPLMEEVSYTVDYGYQAYEPTPKKTYEYTFTSEVTGEKVTVTLPYVGLNKSGTGWIDGFVATVTLKNLDGEEFSFGDHKVTYNENMVLTANDYAYLVNLLGYDTKYYRFNQYTWKGPAYEQGEELWRDITVSGQQYATKYEALYKDTVQVGTTYDVTATYEATVTDKDSEPVYKMEAHGYYGSSLWSDIITFFSDQTKTVITFIGNHKGISLLTLLIIVAMILSIIVIKNYQAAEKEVKEIHEDIADEIEQDEMESEEIESEAEAESEEDLESTEETEIAAKEEDNPEIEL